MTDEYRIGNQIYSTQEEYEKAKKDYQYSQRFMNELDLTQPSMAKNLYEQLEQSQYLMKSSLGEGFKDKLVHIFVSNQLKESRKQEESSEEQTLRTILQREKKKKGVCWYLRGFLLLQVVNFAYTLVTAFVFRLRVQNQVAAHSEFIKLWRFYGYLAGVMVAIHMFSGIALLIYYLIQRMLQKANVVHSLNLLLAMGGINCFELLILIAMRSIV